MSPHSQNSLGFAKSPKDTRVVVAMSGGVDSSAVAAWLKSEGYEVIGITLQLYDHGAALQKSNACCAGRDIHDARRVAEAMDFPHYVLDYETRFSQSVITEFANSYLQGTTPVPCIRCNQEVKFKDLLDVARGLGADCMATGHYIQRFSGANRAELHMAADPRRDQSYFLFATTQEQLEFLRFPLGGFQTKADTRALAARFQLHLADKPDSQDICFVPDGDYAKTIAKIRPGSVRPGDIVDMDGHVLGQHEGIVHYTIGQRRGLGIGGGDPLFVIGLDAVHNRVIVGPHELLARNLVYLGAVNWLGDEPLVSGMRLRVRVRSSHAPKSARVEFEGTKPVIRLDEAEYGVSPGQACVFYAETGTRILGGGWITGSRKAP